MPSETTPRTRLLLVVGLLVLAGLTVHRLILAPQPATTPPAAPLRGEAMGTTWSVKLGDGAPVPAAEVRTRIVAALDTVNASMSTYREDSELSRLSRHPVGEPFELSGALLRVLVASQSLSERTDGAFDVTVGPLVQLWGFGAGAATTEPTADQLDAARRSVGYAKLRVNASDSTATRTVEGLRVDLSAIAKGFAVDLAADSLDRSGVRNYLIEVGGELRVAGERAPGEPWRVGVEAPREDGTRAVHRVLEVASGCVATSGDYRDYRGSPGGPVTHTIDPRVGRPVPRAVASVTVVHSRCMEADGWATALMVLGVEAGLTIAEREGLAVLLLSRERATGAAGAGAGPRLREHASTAFVAGFGPARGP